MAKNTSMSLGEHFADFIDTQVQSGRYGSASEVVRAGLRMLEERETKVKALQEALITGERSGQQQPFDFEELKERKGAEFRRVESRDKSPFLRPLSRTSMVSGTTLPRHGMSIRLTGTPTTSTMSVRTWHKARSRVARSASAMAI